jgi:chromosome partitioning protein
LRIISLINQKGGVGKTTTTVNLAAALAREGQRVCIIDMDPQAHSTTHLGVDQDSDHPSVYDCLLKQTPLADVRREIEPNLCLIPSDLNLAGAEVELAGVVGREMLLRDLCAATDFDYDLVLIDCPPSLGVLTINALTAAHEVFVPLQPHYLALHGLSKLFSTVQLVSKRLNEKLVISGIILCLYETGTRLSAEIVADLERFLTESRKTGVTLPWSQAKIFRTRIRRNIRLAEATSFGQSIFDYEPNSPGARDYAALAQEVLGKPVSLSPEIAAA